MAERKKPKGNHRFVIDYKSSYTINFKCRDCPVIMVIDKFALRRWFTGKEPIDPGLFYYPWRCSN